MKLKNSKHELFCQEYIIDLNASQAYLRAGYKGNCPNARASELKANPSVQVRIQELLDERLTRTRITQDSVINELARIGFFDPVDLINSEAEPAGEDSVGGVARRYTLADKINALFLLGGHVGMWEIDAPSIIDIPSG